ncbi:MAG TPA: alpha-ketoglutarate-dependent dioxygenase AlkB [Flavobacteriaceae bacterium]|nr:alpha-ketoglutarate-dependent dioxygenase AlkB [Flavobacteriaceae bacterium]HPF11827.1 alpha-ketoglutarate-dependent dioxygenase AlkB [Flavobacteriaceae bacterium]HQU22524.1 alpha-ketoglutarate-dependent dioxygenase AlkB [Flavobacteriaceae bacterium]HQU66489.1 alpha-ketoglutarate-dependent dioxygenase AlkB [Flavobacteriaceae bacterium]HRW45367.1 alpha-ketoglutarate-dependent dioxygenase AlkB [Flavobacteriaceae bacterium]
MHDLDPFIKENKASKIRLPLKAATIHYYPKFIPKVTASRYFETLLNSTAWQQDSIKLFGKTHPQPRLTAMYGMEGNTYSYSGITMHPKPFEEIHFTIKEALEKVCNIDFTTVLLNLYRNGNDSNGWHSDDEKELGRQPTIASLSFGADRIFQLKEKACSQSTFKLTLAHGSLLLMQGETQHKWLHQLPKSKRIQQPRINLTFRRIFQTNGSVPSKK